LVIVLSLQTKLGIKVNILVDRALELWNGPSKEAMKKDSKRPVNNHATSQADTLDNSGVQNGMFPPPPAITTTNRSSGQGHDYMLKASGQGGQMNDFDSFSPAPANSALAGGSFW
jgi:hypothetical protein